MDRLSVPTKRGISRKALASVCGNSSEFDGRLVSRKGTVDRSRRSFACTMLRFRVIQGRDYYNPPQHLHPCFVANCERVEAADLIVTEDLHSPIVPLPVRDYMAPDGVARVFHTARVGGAR